MSNPHWRSVYEQRIAAGLERSWCCGVTGDVDDLLVAKIDPLEDVPLTRRNATILCRYHHELPLRPDEDLPQWRRDIRSIAEEENSRRGTKRPPRKVPISNRERKRRTQGGDREDCPVCHRSIPYRADGDGGHRFLDHNRRGELCIGSGDQVPSTIEPGAKENTTVPRDHRPASRPHRLQAP